MDTKNINYNMLDLIHFYWDGPISETRLQILKDSIYSTRIFNPHHNIILWSNSLTDDIFEDTYNINVNTWDETVFDGLPISEEKLKQYMKANPRDFCDLFRLVLLWQFGGSYVDTDDLAIKPISSTPNLICRSYDPHTCGYNKLTDDMCVPGNIREIEGYTHINTFPRNDCWHNWEVKSPFITDLLWNERFLNNKDVVWIGGDFSWQSLTNDTCIKRIEGWKTDWNYGLTLLYLHEDFVAGSSYWDRCLGGGEMCDIWKKLPKMDDYEWGLYKCKRDTALDFYKKVSDIYPNLSHLWLHHKNEKEEWMLEELDEDGLYSVSTWIYWEIKQMIKCFQ
jgi:hypothetical protein